MAYVCKGCGKQATEDQVVNAAGRVKDLDALMRGETPWICSACHLRYLQGKTAERPMALQLCSMEDLIAELFARHEHVVIGFRFTPVDGVNEVREGIYQKGDFRTCQGLAMGIGLHVEAMIQASRMGREQHRTEGDDV